MVDGDAEEGGAKGFPGGVDSLSVGEVVEGGGLEEILVGDTPAGGIEVPGDDDGEGGFVRQFAEFGEVDVPVPIVLGSHWGEGMGGKDPNFPEWGVCDEVREGSTVRGRLMGCFRGEWPLAQQELTKVVFGRKAVMVGVLGEACQKVGRPGGIRFAENEEVAPGGAEKVCGLIHLGIRGQDVESGDREGGGVGCRLLQFRGVNKWKEPNESCEKDERNDAARFPVLEAEGEGE